MVGKQINISIYAPVKLYKASGLDRGSAKFAIFSEATVKFLPSDTFWMSYHWPRWPFLCLCHEESCNSLCGRWKKGRGRAAEKSAKAGKRGGRCTNTLHHRMLSVIVVFDNAIILKRNFSSRRIYMTLKIIQVAPQTSDICMEKRQLP